ncbi:NAD(P)H dehydrogenase [quinone] 1 isoform X2 [Corythoichthys intestinalis]|uniref:NAD(P)H dehydrogenase [quinone] 1 isoform X2 n=1 Tax=Corythoichthys intestinalis TaxID=161448 RepID=UPI0025A610E2|nr:NAD(P)H dehydrogenase [quinone] 1 isoform X2 [Corythoichthys intestinalis]
MADKKVLIVYAHQSAGSFNAAVRDVAIKELSEQGYQVIVSDLYAMNFKANATRDDIIGDLKNPDLFQYGEETMHAWNDGRLSDDIMAEQRKVEEAELVIFQFPMYWFSVPAIMKGWMDRVLTQGFAFSLKNMYDNGIFKNGTLHFCGFQVLAPQIFWNPAHRPIVDRTAMLEKWSARLKGLIAEKSLTYAKCEWFGLSFEQGFLLRPEVQEEHESNVYGITTGHHLGKLLPPDNQIRVQVTDK